MDQNQTRDQNQTKIPSRKERFEFRITRELLAEVESRAGREGVSRAEIVTRAIEAYLSPQPSGDLVANLEKLKAMLLKKYEYQEPVP